MAIKFPRMHIANSVVNRILNVAQGVTVNVVEPNLPVDIPSPADQGADLDAALAAVPPNLPPIDQAPAPGKTLGGTPLLTTVLEPGT